MSGRGFGFDSSLVFTLNLQPSWNVLSDYSPTSFLISARNESRCSTAQASNRRYRGTIRTV